MAVSRYDQRKNYEEAEANAIGTEYVRADLLPAADAARVRDLLRNYLDQRILFYKTRDERQFEQINAYTAQLQKELWSAVQGPRCGAADTRGRPGRFRHERCVELAGYTQAAWWNRIPIAAWGLVAAIAICCNLLIGYGARRKADSCFWFCPLLFHLVLSHSRH